jgi:hypothetical protein
MNAEGVKTQKTKTDVVQGDVLNVFQQLGNGAVLFEFTAGLQEVVQAVRNYPQRSGSVTLKVVVAPMAKGGADRVTVDGAVTVKAPRKPSETKVFFTTKEGTLVRDDPRHMEFNGPGFDRPE